MGMAEAQLARGDEGFRTGMTPAALGVATGVGVVAVGLMVAKRAAAPVSRTGERTALQAYLLDHMAGADAALHVVARLRRSHREGQDAGLFTRLVDEFTGERAILADLLRCLGARPHSFKRLAAHAGGRLATMVAHGDESDLTLFRTVEALCVGVQGKRCLWRSLQALSPAVSNVTLQQLRALESQALDQWDQLDDYRRSLAARTFGARLPA
jgi:hypothetical protein